MAVPEIDDLMFVAMKNQSYMFVCSSRIYVMKTATGKIGLKRSQYLHDWIKKPIKTQILMEIDTQEEKNKKTLFEKILKITDDKYVVWNNEEIWLA